MSLLVIPNVLVNGTGPANIVDAVGLNANFTAIATAVNNIYPSQILPITTGQATFGATATGVGYKFLANDATAVPLTVSGVSSQSADLFDVTLTSGGTKVLSVPASGAVSVGAANSNGTSGDLSVARTSATGTGFIFFGTGGSKFFGYDGTEFIANNSALLVAPIINSVSVSGPVPPAYSATGSPLANTAHIVTGTASGTGSAVTVSLTNNAVFSSGNYAVFVFDQNGGGAEAVTVNGATAFSFPTTNGHSYTYFAMGA